MRKHVVGPATKKNSTKRTPAVVFATLFPICVMLLVSACNSLALDEAEILITVTDKDSPRGGAKNYNIKSLIVSDCLRLNKTAVGCESDTNNTKSLQPQEVTYHENDSFGSQKRQMLSPYQFDPVLEEFPWELDVDQPLYDVPVKSSGKTDAIESSSAIDFVTKGPKWQGSCYYFVENFCIIKGQLTFFSPKVTTSKKGKLRMCSEFSRRSPSIRLKYQTLPMPDKLPAPLLTNRTAWILQFWCQDLFHMTLSMMPAWATKQLLFLNNPKANPFFPNAEPDIFLRIARGKRKRPEDYCNIKLGHPQSWNVTKNHRWQGGNYMRQDKQFPFAGNPYWPFYRVLTTNPWRIHALYPKDSQNNGTTKTACYKNGVIDKLYIKDTRQSTAAQYVQSQRESMGIYPTRRRQCGKYRLTFIDRRGRTRKLSNIPELVAIANNFTTDFAPLPFVAKSVALEHITISEQIQLMSDTDLLIGMHGNGLTWLQFLSPGSVVVELFHIWYQPYCKLFGHKHLFASKKKSPINVSGGFPTALNATYFQEILLESTKFLQSTSCGDTIKLFPVDEPLANLYRDCVPHC